MTWTIYGSMDDCRAKANVGNIGSLLCECLEQAHRDQRVKCGVLECAKLLRCNPDNVMICLLPAASGHHDVTLDIQHTLIEAFCWENDIKLFKVDSQEKLTKMMSADVNNNGDNALSDMTPDVSCLLIEYPKGEVSSEDDLLLYHSDQLKDDNCNTLIELPV